jgi:hypothetical protein
LFLRRLKVYNAAVSVFFRIRWAMYKSKGMDDEDPRSLKIWNECHVKNAGEMFDVGTELEGVWIKAGQYMLVHLTRFEYLMVFLEPGLTSFVRSDSVLVSTLNRTCFTSMCTGQHAPMSCRYHTWKNSAP